MPKPAAKPAKKPVPKPATRSATKAMTAKPTPTNAAKTTPTKAAKTTPAKSANNETKAAQPAKRKATAAPAQAKATKRSKAQRIVEEVEELEEAERKESVFAKEVDAISDDDNDSSVDERELEEDEKAIKKKVDVDVAQAESAEAADHEILAGIDSSDDEDSSDEEAKKDSFSAGTDIISLGSKKDKELKTKTAAVKKSSSDKPSVIYLGRIPHGFYEEQMQAYFAQFGEVSRLRMSRNRKTGRSKHFAFIEFSSGEVADIVAETMNNYLLYGHLLKCQVVLEEKLHPKLWEGADRKFKIIPWNKVAREQQNKPKTPEKREKLVTKLVKKDRKKREKLAELGMEYEFPGYEAELKPKPTHVKF